jgi:hypothetical protein
MQREVDVDVHLLNDWLIDGPDAFFEAYGIGPGGAVLVRPDGFVGWRSIGPIDGDASACTTALARALTTLTCRDL